MTITLEAEIGKSNIENFTEFTEFIFQRMLETGRELICRALEVYDRICPIHKEIFLPTKY